MMRIQNNWPAFLSEAGRGRRIGESYFLEHIVF